MTTLARVCLPSCHHFCMLSAVYAPRKVCLDPCSLFESYSAHAVYGWGPSSGEQPKSSFTGQPGSMDAEMGCGVHALVSHLIQVTSAHTANKQLLRFFYIRSYNRIKHPYSPNTVHSACISSSEYTMQASFGNQTHP